MDFVNKTVDHIDKEVTAVIIWKNEQFYARVGRVNYYIDNWNNLANAIKVYSLPTNLCHYPWTEKPIKKPNLNKIKEHNDLGILFWGKYKPNLKIKGVIKKDIFYDKFYNDKSVK